MKEAIHEVTCHYKLVNINYLLLKENAYKPYIYCYIERGHFLHTAFIYKASQRFWEQGCTSLL